MSKQEKKGPEQHTAASSGLLKWIELLGNKLPHPFWMFVWISVFIVGLSAVAALLGLSAVDPGSGAEVAARNLLSGYGLRRFLEEMVTNFAYFAPFGLVLVMLMGVSVAEKGGDRKSTRLNSSHVRIS